MEIDGTVNQSIERIVLANGNAIARVVLGATLANDDVAGYTLLATPDLHAKSLGCTLAAVLRTTYTFFMCHTSVPPLSDYLFNFNLSELLTMAVLLARVLATLHLEDNHLLALNQRVHYFYYYLCTCYGGCANLDSAVGIYEQHFVKLNSLACLHVLDVVSTIAYIIICL